MLYGIRLLQSTQNQSDFNFMWLYILHDLANEWMNKDNVKSCSFPSLKHFEVLSAEI